jgi:ribosomal-protein-alanine N-acetyltransferase
MPLLIRKQSFARARDDFSVTLAGLSDVPEMDRIEQAAFATPWSRELIRSAILNRKYQVRVLRTPELPVAGFYIAHTTDQASNLDNLVVETHARRQGYGRRLVNAWINEAWIQSLATLTLQVNTVNGGAQRLYRQFQFRPIRLLVGYYPNGDDAFQMEMTFAAHLREGRVPPLLDAAGG